MKIKNSKSKFQLRTIKNWKFIFLLVCSKLSFIASYLVLLIQNKQNCLLWLDVVFNKKLAFRCQTNKKGFWLVMGAVDWMFIE